MMIFTGTPPVTTAGVGIHGTILTTPGVGTPGIILTTHGHGTVAGTIMVLVGLADIIRDGTLHSFAYPVPIT